jgi:hypothetical protein
MRAGTWPVIVEPPRPAHRENAMLVRRLAVATALLLVPVATACGDGGGTPSTSELSAKIQESEPDMPEEQATCMAEALRDVLPADALREITDADLEGDAEQIDEAAFERVSESDGVRLMGALFECVDLEGLDMGEFDDLDTGDGEDPGQNPFEN